MSMWSKFTAYLSGWPESKEERREQKREEKKKRIKIRKQGNLK